MRLKHALYRERRGLLLLLIAQILDRPVPRIGHPRSGNSAREAFIYRLWQREGLVSDRKRCGDNKDKNQVELPPSVTHVKSNVTPNGPANCLDSPLSSLLQGAGHM